MKVEFNNYKDLANILWINGWGVFDKYNVSYDELNGDKRIIITRIKDESK